MSLRLRPLLRRPFALSRRPESSVNSPNSAARRTGKSDQDISDAIETSDDREKLCGYAVVFGVVLEYVPKLVGFIGDPSWLSFRDLIGGILIALGVAGELRFGNRASELRDELNARKNLRIAELNELAERERLARIEIEERLAFRTLTDDQKQHMAEILKVYSGQRYVPYCVTPTPDVAGVCAWLSEVLKMGEWESLSQFMMIHAAAVIPGIRIGNKNQRR